jgi:hypothetical protein
MLSMFEPFHLWTVFGIVHDTLDCVEFSLLSIKYLGLARTVYMHCVGRIFGESLQILMLYNTCVHMALANPTN